MDGGGCVNTRRMEINDRKFPGRFVVLEEKVEVTPLTNRPICTSLHLSPLLLRCYPFPTTAAPHPLLPWATIIIMGDARHRHSSGLLGSYRLPAVLSRWLAGDDATASGDWDNMERVLDG